MKKRHLVRETRRKTGEIIYLDMLSIKTTRNGYKLAMHGTFKEIKQASPTNEMLLKMSRNSFEK